MVNRQNQRWTEVLHAVGLALGVAAPLSALANAPGQAVTIGATQDNSTIKITFGSYSSVTSAAPVGNYGVSYITPSPTWSTDGSVLVTFQIFNPGGFSSGTIPKISQGLGFNMVPTAASGFTYTSTTSTSVSSVAVPTVGTLTATTTFSGVNEYPTGGTIPSSGTYSYIGANANTLNAPTSPATGGGDIITWKITPNAGKKIYVSDFYKTPSASSPGTVFAGFHLQGVNASSSWIGATAANIVYVTPEPGTWAAIVGLGGIAAWQGASTLRRRKKTVALVAVA